MQDTLLDILDGHGGDDDDDDEVELDQLESAVESLGEALDRLERTPPDLKGAGVELERASKELAKAVKEGQIESITGKGMISELKVLSKELKDSAKLVSKGLFASTGTIDILYSPQAVAKVVRFFSSLTILNWREGPTPNNGADR
jgi:hypothetical protein